MIAPPNRSFITPFRNAQMLNDLNSRTGTAISSVSETTCATIREMKKGVISIIGSPRAKGLKKGTLMRTAGVRILGSPFEHDCSSARHMFRTRREEKKKTGEKRTRKRKETSWRHRPETERFQMRWKREDREDERELRADGHPRCPPALPTCCYTKPQIRCFAICQSSSMCDTVRYDMTVRDETKLCYLETIRGLPNIAIP